MSHLATAYDFEGQGVDSLYSAVGGVAYREYPFFAVRASQIRGRFSNLSAKILVAGCGYGYLVKHLVDLGYTDVWGCDASAYAIQKAQDVLPANLSARIIQADITNRNSLNALRTAAGLPGNQRFAAVITEDVLPVLDNDAEAQLALTELRRVSSAMAHVITCCGVWPMVDGGAVWVDDNGTKRTKSLLWKTSAQWRALINVPSEWIASTETGEVG